MEKNSNKQTEILQVSEEVKKQLLSDLILTGKCEYTASLFTGIPVVFKSLTWNEQETLSRNIGDIVEDIPTSDGTTRKITVNEFNLEATKHTLMAYIKTFNKKPFNISNTSSQVVNILSKKVREFIALVDSLLDIEEVKN